MKKKIIFISIIFVLIDILSKILISNLDSTITIINNFFYIEKVTNTGAAFSILQGNIGFLIIINIFLLFYIIISIPDNLKKHQIALYSMIIGGILGNTINRIYNGYIIDFIKIKMNNYIFPIFNFADIFITIGIIILIISIIKDDKYGNNSKKK